ncbi:SPOSA6832_04299 [Sporobolomyces salmonicolor]|uniref:SPOSA6832_04299-mRNA-1:cds n=1 Tax=Sporidiobolus salmonicolor TaxID=5005 RepID=A0A0D6ESB1_SPOSA|nr:SPOSA6832_04299 [Sporobolomyces salmonicolor]
MQVRRSAISSLSILSALITAATAQVEIPVSLGLGSLGNLDLDIGLLQDGALVNLNAFGNILADGSCPDANVGVEATVLGLVNVCACVNVLDAAAGACPDNAQPICGGAGVCACACDSNYYAVRLPFCRHARALLIPFSLQTADGTCAAFADCVSPNVYTSEGTYSVCTCAAGYRDNGAGGCALAPSARARSRRSVKLPGQEAFFPQSSESRAKAGMSCPDGETACPLTSGGFECIDTTSLDSCGGCVGAGFAGENCLAIPGALAVACRDARCHVGSCFAGWTFDNGRCI